MKGSEFYKAGKEKTFIAVIGIWILASVSLKKKKKIQQWFPKSPKTILVGYLQEKNIV